MDKDEALEAAKAVERGELPSGSVVLAVTGDNSLSHPGYPNGRCGACGFGLTKDNACNNIECTRAVTYRAALFNAPTGNRYTDVPFEHVKKTYLKESFFDTVDDPIGRNAHRGRRAGLAIRKYIKKYDPNEENATQLADFLADLLHLCDMTDTNFDGALETARIRYEEEVLGE